MKKDTKFKAFSLIETLLVIAIVSVLMLLGYMLAYKYIEQVKVERAASQVKQLLEAGVKYYVVNNQWPAYPLTSSQPDFRPYLSFGNLTNPWGQEYIYAVDGMKFVVTTALPNNNLANRVVNLLIDASAVSNTIKAEILVAPNYNRASMYINDIGTFELMSSDLSSDGIGNASFTAKPCPIGWEQNVAVTINNIEFGTLLTNIYMPMPYGLGAPSIVSCSDNHCKLTVSFRGEFCNPPEGGLFSSGGMCYPDTRRIVSMAGPVCGGTQECTSASTDKVVAENGKIGFYYISYCKK